MWWLYLCVGLATAGVLVLGVLAVRVFVAVQELARQLGRSTDQVTRAAEELRRSAGPLAARTGEASREATRS